MMYPYGFGFFDPTMLILIPAILLTLYAQGKVKTSFAKYLRVQTRKNYTGAQVARMLLNEHGLNDIPIEVTPGQMSDHYDPVKQVLRLSPDVYRGSSVAAVSVAAHEVGHAIQHDMGYIPLTLRNKIFPVARFGSSAAWFFIIIGLLLPAFTSLLDVGILLFATAVLFQVVTLPVEFNASNRAMQLLDTHGFITASEAGGAKKVLNAAALTYVAAMAAGMAQLLRLLIIRGRR
ncbi:MAG: zinc metallopeptidase [Tindallia sp. MSAO_Bac2]|nr:MAG: zinc metallopeptidase [Tindallia sp. MSAO_Bac2]